MARWVVIIGIVVGLALIAAGLLGYAQDIRDALTAGLASIAGALLLAGLALHSDSPLRRR